MESCDPKNISNNSYTSLCQYVKNVNACTFTSGFLNYFEWQYCGFDERVTPTLLMFLWFLVLLMAVATTADSFFAPCLVVVTRILRMSQNLAGVTLLALGNGAADVFSSLSAVLSSSDPNVGLAFGSILGAGILVNTVTAGVIMIICPFEVMRRPIIKDLAFYLLALVWCTVILIKRQIELWSAMVLLSIYIVYVFVTAISRAFYVKCKKHLKKQTSNDNIQVTVSNPPTFNNEENVPSVSNRSHKNNNTVNQLNAGHNNPSYINDNFAEFLNVPHFEKFNNDFLDPVQEIGTSIVDLRTNSHTLSKKRAYNSLDSNHVKSTSHRSLGSFARIIIKNEHEREIMKSNSRIQSSKHILRKSVSLCELNEITPKIKIRFYSAGEVRKSRSEANSFSKHSFNRPKEERRDKLNRNSILSIQNASADSNLNDILQISSTNNNISVTFPGTLKHFLLTILPVELEDWDEQSFLKKILLIMQSPVMFVLTMTIPVVEDGAFLKGWCKILNCLHCISSPLIWITFIHVNMNPIGSDGFIVTYLILIIGGLTGIAVAITSEANNPPIYHPFFAFIGFITSIFWIYEIVNEIVNVLITFGVVLSIPQTILGLSILAFANSVGDLVSNITLAKRNYPKIAYAACIGGPLFNLLVGVGLPFSIKTAQKAIPIKLKSETVVLISTILMVTVLNVVALPLMKFHVKKFYGVILIFIYIIFFVLVILFAADIIKVSM